MACRCEPVQLHVMWSWRHGLQARADDCSLSCNESCPGGVDRCSECGPENAVIAVLTRFDCRPLHIMASYRQCDNTRKPSGQGAGGAVGRRSLVGPACASEQLWESFDNRSYRRSIVMEGKSQSEPIPSGFLPQSLFITMTCTRARIPSWEEQNVF